jgi:hypothetical protein
VPPVPEGVATADGQVAQGVHDDPDSPPPASAEAPKGWAWQRKSRSWKPRERGPVLWHGEGAPEAPGADAPAPDTSGHGSAVPGPEQHDPEPSWMRQDPAAGDGKKSTGGKLKFDDVPQAVKDDMAGLAGLVATPILSILQTVDPYCGTVLAQNFGPVLDATLPIICRSEKIVAYFTTDQADWLLWGKLALALAPVAKAFADHHIFRTVQVVKDPKTGQISIQHGKQQQGQGDHLAPAPQPEYSYVA